MRFAQKLFVELKKSYFLVFHFYLHEEPESILPFLPEYF